jgi:hypothetical protein
MSKTLVSWIGALALAGGISGGDPDDASDDAPTRPWTRSLPNASSRRGATCPNATGWSPARSPSNGPSS